MQSLDAFAKLVKTFLITQYVLPKVENKSLEFNYQS